ncbi:phage tail protein [Xenorhabdus khoisanae]|uniref:phage tail protein n=1 Tax=Xenorhabdus khoisanae TaxID=880157 RepID=UPI00235A407F|nr:phage tail protein [Xenorhabdus khoisanae]MDC9614505.1 phage tail protein [Xenorhabdus khoisanae]
MQDKKPETQILEDDGLVVVPTPEYVKDLIEEHAQSRNHPDATLQDKGFVVLSNDISGSETMAATPKAVKAAYDLANTANQTASSADNLANAANNLANIANENANLALPIGVPVPWPTENPPEGWLICNGESFDTARYPKLALAYPSGVLPDLRGEFIRGWDDGRGVDAGRHLLSNQVADIAPHSHRVHRMWSSSTAGAENLGTGNRIFNSVQKNINYGADPRGLGIAIGMGSGGYGYMDNAVANSTGTETRPRNIAFNYIVRAA